VLLRQLTFSTLLSTVLYGGVLLAQFSKPVHAQTNQFSCRPNDNQDGWICEALEPGSPQAIGPQTSNDQAAQDTTAVQADSAPTAGRQPSRATGLLRDWVPVEQLTAEQLEAIDNSCCGAFIEPARAGIDPTADPTTSGMAMNATRGIREISEESISIDGEVELQQGNRTVENNATTTVTLREEGNTVLMQGDVVFREPGVLLLGDSAFLDDASGVNLIENAEYVIHNFSSHGRAEAIAYATGSGRITIDNGEFSRCEPEQPFWQLRARNMVLDPDRGRGTAEAVSLRIRDFPVFYYPYTLPFPLGDERMSGLLAPSAGSTRSGGFDFELPYYFNLAPNYDATLSPRLISDRGVLLNAEARHLSSWSTNTLNMSFLGDDKLFDPATAGIAGEDSPPTAKRWFVGLEHRGRLSRNWSTAIDYDAVSDSDFFRDFGSNGLNLASRTHLNRSGRLHYQNNSLQMGVNARRLQIIDPVVAAIDLNKPYDRLPQFYFDTEHYLNNGFYLALQGQATAFDRSLEANRLSPTAITNGALVTGERVNLIPELGWSAEAPGWFLRSTAKFDYASYSLEDQAVNTVDNPERGVAVFSLDAGLVFERPLSLGNGGYTQTLEPRLYYLNSEFENQSNIPIFDTSELNFSFNQLFRDDRFSGGDRVTDADQLTYAITTRILDPLGKERARFSLGQIQFFADRQVSLDSPLRSWIPRVSPTADTSALAGEISYAFSDNWRINTDVQWNEDTQRIREGSFQFRYQSANERIFNVGYRFRNFFSTPGYTPPANIDPRIKQSDVSGIWPLSNNWRLLGRWNYDHSNSRNLESFAGIEFSNCCATIRLVGREWIDQDELFVPDLEPNRGVFLQFTLHGLGNLAGGGLSGLLSDGILGFRDDNFGNSGNRYGY